MTWRARSCERAPHRGLSGHVALGYFMLSRQTYPHRRAGTDSRGHLDAAVVVGDDAMNGGQAETRAALERAAERLKDGVDLVGRNPAAFVLDGENDFRTPGGVPLRAGRQPQAAAPLH